MKNKIGKYALYTAILVFIGLIGIKVFYTQPVTYQADHEPVQTVEEVKDGETQEDIEKRVELYRKQLVLEKNRENEIKRHDEEIARIEAELEKVRTDQVSL